MELLAPGSGLALPWLLWAFGSNPTDCSEITSESLSTPRHVPLLPAPT